MTKKKYLKVCPICNRSFEADSASTVYCSIECREKGSRKNLLEWRKRTNYNERKKLEQRKRRSEEKAIRSKKRRERLASLGSKDPAEYISKLQEEAEKGDLYAALRVELLKHGNKSPEYWRTYKAAIIHDGEGRGVECETSVNGVYIHDPDFAEKVAESIRTPGATIYIRAIR